MSHGVQLNKKCTFYLISLVLERNSSSFSFSQSFLYRCIGVILQQCYNKELVRKQLQEILISARHNDAIERTVCHWALISSLLTSEIRDITSQREFTVKQLAEAPHAWKHTKTFSGELWEIMKKFITLTTLPQKSEEKSNIRKNGLNLVAK